MAGDELPDTAKTRSSLQLMKAHPVTIALCLASCVLVGFNFWYTGLGLRARKFLDVDPSSKRVKEQVRLHNERQIEYLEARQRSHTSDADRNTYTFRASESTAGSGSTPPPTPSAPSLPLPLPLPPNQKRDNKSGTTSRVFAVDPFSKNPDYDFKVPDRSRKTSECDMCSARACKAVHATSLHRRCCNTTGTTQVWPLLVTGTPRSGTVAVANLLTALGLDVRSDWSKPGEHGHISWIHLFNEQHDIQRNRSKFVVPAYGRGYAHIGRRYWSGVHLVRNPLKSITSIACTEPFFQTQWWFFVTAHVEIDTRLLLTLNHFGVAMAFFLAWHKAADATCMYRLRLEDLFSKSSTPAIADLFNLAGLGPPSDAAVRNAIASVGHESNARIHRPTVAWEELFAVDRRMAGEVLALSRQYGYAYADVDEALLNNTPQAARESLPNCQLDTFYSDWGGGGYELPTLKWD